MQSYSLYNKSYIAIPFINQITDITIFSTNINQFLCINYGQLAQGEIEIL